MKLLISVVAFMTLLNGFVIAEEAETYEEALKLSGQLNKPVLLEFFKEDCEYCSQAAQDAINRDDIKQALNQIVHYTVNFKSEQGKKLEARYQVGIYFPVFYLLNHAGDIIQRWTGYTTAGRFIGQLNSALGDLTTINEKEARFKAQPSVEDALFLARYYTDTWDYLKANEYYGEARKIRGNDPAVFSYDIFQNCANAAWQDSISFDQVLPAADSVLTFRSTSKADLVKVAQIMARLGRKLNETDRIGKYIQAAIDITSNSKSSKDIEDNTLLKSEYALYVDKDTTEAIRLKKTTLPEGWESNPEQFYGYAKWCLEHNIDLENARMLTLKATGMASPGEFRGKVYNTLAQICDALKDYQEAVQYMRLAIKDDPHDPYYPDHLTELEKKLK